MSDGDPTPTAEDREPAFKKVGFDCPHCATYAHHRWSHLMYAAPGGGYIQADEQVWGVSFCSRCNQMCIWFSTGLVFPRRRLGPVAHGDMPEDVRALYDEAREVAPVSRKSAAALLRLALQVLVDELQPGPGDINGKIGALVKTGLDPAVQQAMDVVRVVGNNAVHPGQIDLDADGELVPALFNLLNLIVEQVVARPKRLQELYATLPAGAQAAIARRDAP